ncbi:MAG: glycosyltransferase [Candidatus Saccharibacteria bacterium]|nr:glycosyltransferase [Candidatus Saccharibacteria bacterium]
MNRVILSVVVPVWNEEQNIEPFYEVLEPVVHKETSGAYEIIYVDDGSSDKTAAAINGLIRRNKQVKLLSLSRNFGKEIAMAAGIAQASGKAVMTIDGDGQHPPKCIPEFVAAWKQGAQVVVGVRVTNHSEGFIKKYGSKLFYSLFNGLSGVSMVPGSSDFRLIDREVQQEFVKLHEPQTITRGLIDWLGFKRVYIKYAAEKRVAGDAGYKVRKLMRLAVNSFVSLSPKPLYAFGYLGLIITLVSFVLGSAVIVEQLLLGDPWQWEFTGTAMLSILVLFLVGLILVAQGVLALYVSYIHTQAKDRPLYVINRRESVGLPTDNS